MSLQNYSHKHPQLLMEVSTNSHKNLKPNTDQEVGLRSNPIHKKDCKASMAEDHQDNRMTVTRKILSVQECDQNHQEEEQNFTFNNIIVPCPVPVLVTSPSSPDLKLEKLKFSSDEKNDNNGDLNNKFKTPTSLDRKIPMLLVSPGAPRKKTMRPSSSMKRKATCFVTRKILSVQECDQNHQEEEHNFNFNNIITPCPVPVLVTSPSSPDLKLEKLKFSSDEKNDNNGDLNKFKTPTSLDHKIPMLLDSPGAPRKKTTRSSSSMKRKAACSPGPVSNLSKKMESMSHAG